MRKPEHWLGPRWRHIRQVRRLAALSGQDIPCDFADFEEFVAYIEKHLGEPRGDCNRLHRRELSRGYVAGNLVWSRQREVSSDCAPHQIEIAGERGSVGYFAERYGVNYATAYSRLQRGWSAERAFGSQG